MLYYSLDEEEKTRWQVKRLYSMKIRLDCKHLHVWEFLQDSLSSVELLMHKPQ